MAEMAEDGTEQDRTAAQAAHSVLQRKAGAGRPRPAHPIPGAQKGVRLALARAGRDVPGLDLTVSELRDDGRSLAELLELIPERALLAVLEGPAEGLGLVALALPVLSGIVEVLTMGRLAPDERAARRPTRTDAAMTAGLIDKLLTELEGEFAESRDLVWAGGFRYASFLDDPRPLELLLDDIPYRLFSVEVGLAGGARQGEILLALPAEGRGPEPQVLRPVHAPAADDGAATRWTQAMDEAVQGAEVRLTGVLHRLRLPLSAVMGLKPGDMLPVPASQLERIELEAIDGRGLGGGRLGQNRGMRAVRLTRLPQGRGAVPPDPAAGGFDGAAGVAGAATAMPEPLADLPLPHPAPLGVPMPEGADGGGLPDLSPDLPMPPMAMPLDGLDPPEGEEELPQPSSATG